MPRTVDGKYVTEASKIFQEGDDFWHAGSYDEAGSAYEKSAALYHEKHDAEGEAFALSRLGELEISLNNYERAEKALLSAIELTRDLELAQNTYGEVLIKLSKL